MPGANCSITMCGTSRREKGVGIFRLPAGADSFTVEWRAKLLSIVTKDRVVDAQFRQQIDSGLVYICEKHFDDHDIETVTYAKTTKKFMVKGAIPTKCLPQKTFQTPAPKERASRVRETVSQPSLLPSKIYKSFADMCRRVKSLKLSKWCIEEREDRLVLQHEDASFALPKFQLTVDDSLGFSIAVFSWMLPEDHEIYLTNHRSIRNISISNLTSTILQYKVCSGVLNKAINPNLVLHVVPKKFDPLRDDHQSYHREEVCRALDCVILLEAEDDPCLECAAAMRKVEVQQKVKERNLSEPAKLKAPVTATAPQKVKLALQQERLKCSQLQERVAEMERELQRCSVSIDDDLDEDLTTIFQQCGTDATPFMKLFWEEQKKLGQTSNMGSRYHPMIIRYCLSLASKSPACYDELRASNILRLPSRRTLRDYKNWVRPQRGFNGEIVNELQERTSSFFDTQRYMVLMFDEMKIQADLVYDKSTGELIGFLDLGDPDLNFGTIDKSQQLASYVLAFLVRGVAVKFLFPLAHFATDGANSLQLMPLFWEAVSILELMCNLWVVAVVCDGASPNRCFFKLHAKISDVGDRDIIHKTINIYDPSRYIFFFADAPHLMKTSRNCLSHSGMGKYSRLMWNSGTTMLWKHIADAYYADLERDLKLLPRLTYEHVNLNCFSSMRVNLAVQVLSSTMSKVLQTFGPAEASATAEFCCVMDTFFDCMNVRSTGEWKAKNKNGLKPFTSIDDERLRWLEVDFLGYFRDWKQSIDERKDQSFSKSEKDRMFISRQTHEGLQITARSAVGVIKFLLAEGTEYILTERFCQDPVEEYFGYQRKLGRRNDNPNLRTFGYNDNSIRIQGRLAPVAGNTKGKYQGQKTKWVNVDEKPLKKRKGNSLQSEI